MANVINMPRLSDTMTEGTVATWLKKVGDTVKSGDILAEIETDKATMEFESFSNGVLLHIGVEAGQTAPVDSLLAIIGQAGEDIQSLIAGGSVPAAPAAAATPAPAVETAPSAAPALPAGVTIVTMPRLSDTMTEGTVASWLKNLGDTVKSGDILAEIETDKATMEFESFHNGTLLHIGVAAGQSASVDSVLAIIGPVGTDVSAFVHGVPASSSATTVTTTAEVAAPASAPSTVVATATAAPASNGRIFASPLARKLAAEKGINLADVTGSGENGRIVRADVMHFNPAAAVAAPVAASAAPAPVVVAQGTQHTEEVKNSSMRKTIAKRLSESYVGAPHFYLTVELLMDEAMAARQALNQVPDTKISFNDMVIKAAALALRKHPKVNSQWREDATLLHSHIHMGVAVAVEDGLVVPVLKFADQMGMQQIGAAVKDLAGKAKNKKLQPQEMEGSTFTISNLGMFGISSFTSIINQPNSAILSVGAIIEKPVVKNGQLAVGHTMTVTLACDHRTIDGATGAQFLQTFKTYLENPVTMLL